MYKYRIALINCWYGPFPWYFPYFIHSCRYNPTIDFYIITDNKEFISNKPNNVIIINKSIGEIQTLASEKLGFLVNIDYPYKLCDFKPTFGYLFSEIIDGYDFWGHTDIDLVYGDIRNFMTYTILSVYDVISSRHDFITGAFCLYRNLNKYNTLFMQSRDYKKVLSNSEHFCFDECNFLFTYLTQGGSVFDFPNAVQSMTYVVKKAEEEGQLRAYFDFIIIDQLMSSKIKWDKGKIIYKDLFEGMYYNLINYKDKCKSKTVLNPIPETFYFYPAKIVAKK